MPQRCKKEVFTHQITRRKFSYVGKWEFQKSIRVVFRRKWRLQYRLAGLANPNIIFVIAPCGEIALFPVEATPFLVEIGSTWGSSMQEIPRAPNDAAAQKAGRSETL
jgi:hypothetical protein